MHDLQSPIKSTIHLLSEVEANALYSKKQTNKKKNKKTLIYRQVNLTLKKIFFLYTFINRRPRKKWSNNDEKDQSQKCQ